MDSIYPTFAENATEKINIKNYFEKYEKVLPPLEYPDLNKIFFDKKKLKQLTDKCSEIFFDYEEDLPLTVQGPKKSQNIPKDTKLETLRWLKSRNDSIKKKKKKIEDLAGPVETPVIYEKINDNKDIIVPPRNEIVILIRIYHAQKVHEGQTHVEPSLMFVGAILGSQTLDKLRDLIPCISDLTPAVDRSENPFFEPLEDAITNKEIYKSAFFFIENTFYNDTRHPENKDNSAVIRKWAETRGIGIFDTAKMEETQIDSLEVRFGYPYLYQHQGTCEHFIVFSDARLIDQDLDVDLTNFPRFDRVHAFRHRKCVICGEHEAKWMVTESDRIPHDPCYFCEICFLSYNYHQGKKLGNFKAYHWPYDPKIVKIRNEIIKQEGD